MRQKSKSSAWRGEMPGCEKAEFSSDASGSSTVHPSCGTDEGPYLQNLPDTAQVGFYTSNLPTLFFSVPNQIKKEVNAGDNWQIQYPMSFSTLDSSDVPGVSVKSMLEKEVEKGTVGSAPGNARAAEDRKAASSTTPSSIFFSTIEVPYTSDTAVTQDPLARLQVENRAGIPVEVQEKGPLDTLGTVANLLLEGSLASPHVHGVGAHNEASEDLQSIMQISGCLSHAGVEDPGEGKTHPFDEQARQAGCLSDCLADMLESGLFSRMAPQMEGGMVITCNSSDPKVGERGAHTVGRGSSQENSIVIQETSQFTHRKPRKDKEKKEKKQVGFSEFSVGSRFTDRSGWCSVLQREEELLSEKPIADCSCVIAPDLATPSLRPCSLIAKGSKPKALKINDVTACAEVADSAMREGASAQKCCNKLSAISSSVHVSSPHSTPEYTSDLFEGSFKAQVGIGPDIINARQLPVPYKESNNAHCIVTTAKVAKQSTAAILNRACEDEESLSKVAIVVLKPDGQLDESTSDKSIALPVGVAENTLLESLEEVPPKTVHSDTEEVMGSEIEAGTTRAFLEWDGEDTICNMDEMDQSPPAIVADCTEEQEGAFYRPWHGAKIAYYRVVDSVYRLLGTRGSPDTNDLCKLQELESVRSEDESGNPQCHPVVMETWLDKENMKNIQATEETPPTTALFTPYGASVFKKPPKLGATVCDDVPGDKNTEKRRKKKKAFLKGQLLLNTSAMPTQSMAQVRDTCLNVLCDIMQTRVTESTDIILPEESVRNVASNIEYELFALCKGTAHLYKKKYRTLAFNLRDPKNKLFREVVLGEVTPQCLVLMSPTELASQELTEWRDQENKHALDIIEEEERKVQTWQVTKLTHKGLIEIDADTDQMLSLEDLEGPLLAKEQALGAHLPAKSKNKDLPNQHKGSLPDCFIWSENEPSQKKTTSVLERFPSKEAAENSHISNGERSIASNDSNEKMGPVPARNLHQKAVQVTVWTGFLKMFTLKKFAAKAFHVSGYGNGLCQALPEVIEAQSCILPEAVWEYMDKIWPAESKEMSIMRFSPSDAKDAHAYSLLYAYLNNKQRYGILTCEAMEAFVVPLASYQPIPSKLHPLGGPGLEESHNNLLLAVILPKMKPGDLLMLNKRPDASRKRKSVTFDKYVGRQYNVKPPIHRTQHPRPRQAIPTFQPFHSPSPCHDSWDSPPQIPSPTPSPQGQSSISLSPDYLDRILHELEIEPIVDDGDGTQRGEHSTSVHYTPVAQQDGWLLGDPGDQEACRSGLVNVLQLLSHNIPMMSDPYGILPGAAATYDNLVNTGFPLPCGCSGKGLGPVYPQSTGTPCFTQAASAYSQPGEGVGVAPQFIGGNDLQSVLQALLNMTSQISLPFGTQNPGFIQSGGLCAPLMPQPDAFVAHPLASFIPGYSSFTPGS
ncbi:SPOC domain-containing protein 1 isoform X2 [Ambystoma mexicanum]|uniref:SPOC domain-containing protein 1 isoform X2 n=1 Tax=Ambystoma mexicanum TaxID=8296 RepID=UPI0037E78661